MGRMSTKATRPRASPRGHEPAARNSKPHAHACYQAGVDETGDEARKARERAIEAIADQARVARARAPHSRAMWIAAGLVLVLSIVACVAILLSDGEPTTKPRVDTEGRLGFSPGIVIGIAIGILIGFAIAKRRNYRDESSSPHSDRSRP